MALDVKQAIQTAMDYVQSAFEDEGIENLGLEEIEISEGKWKVTVGFSRPWDHPKLERRNSIMGMAPLSGLQSREDLRPERTYKVISIDSQTGEIESMMIRNVA